MLGRWCADRILEIALRFPASAAVSFGVNLKTGKPRAVVVDLV
jgi:hypothetical protein